MLLVIANAIEMAQGVDAGDFVDSGATRNTLTSGPASRKAEAKTASAGDRPDNDNTVGIQ